MSATDDYTDEAVICRTSTKQEKPLNQIYEGMKGFGCFLVR